jgi:hypothetical protein
MNATDAILAHQFCSPAEARRVLRIGKNAIYNAIRDGDIPSLRLKGVIKVPTSWLRAQAGYTDAA